MNKEVRTAFKELKKEPCVVEAHSVQNKGHWKWHFTVETELNEFVSAQVSLGNSASDWRWKKNHQRNLKKTLN